MPKIRWLSIIRWPTLCLFLLVCCACSDATRSTTTEQLTKDEAQRLAWLVEDVCHGLERRPSELLTETCSISTKHFVRWLRTTVASSKHVAYPTLMEKRIQRWQIIRNGLEKTFITRNQNGILTIAASDTAQLYKGAVMEENIARHKLDTIILGQSGLDGRSLRAKFLLEQLRLARQELDNQHLSTLNREEH